MKKLHILKHPLIDVKLSILRDKTTSSSQFKASLSELTMLMTYELTKDLATQSSSVETPLEEAEARLLKKKITLMPIMRAGMGMSEPIHQLIPEASVGQIGLFRNEETKRPVEYYFKAPNDVTESTVILIDPMLATGGSAVAALDKLKERGINDIRFICLIAAPEGIEALQNAHPEITIYTAAVDKKLDENAYIRPGLGDAGDRIFGTEG